MLLCNEFTELSHRLINKTIYFFAPLQRGEIGYKFGAGEWLQGKIIKNKQRPDSRWIQSVLLHDDNIFIEIDLLFDRESFFLFPFPPDDDDTLPADCTRAMDWEEGPFAREPGDPFYQGSHSGEEEGFVPELDTTNQSIHSPLEDSVMPEIEATNIEGGTVEGSGLKVKLRRLSQPTNSKFRSSNPHAASCFTPVDEQFIEPTSKTKTGAKKRKGKSQRRRTSQTHVRQTLTRPVRQSLRRSLRRAEKKRVADADSDT